MATVAHSSPRADTQRVAGGGNLKFIVASGVIALAVVYLVVVGLQGTTQYFLTVSELQARGPAAQNQILRVSGNLVPDSLFREADGVGVHFLIADPTAASPLMVSYRGGQVPDMMTDPSNDVQIVAEGKLNAQGAFAATEVLAKCPSRLADANLPQERDYSATTN